MQKKHEKSNVISLLANEHCEGVAFLAVCLRATGESCNAEAVRRGLSMVLTLTSKVMMWQVGRKSDEPGELGGTEMIFILDLRPCSTYWRKRALQEQVPLEDYLAAVLQTTVIQTSSGWQVGGAFAPHPWAALLLAGIQRYRGRPGFLSFTTPLGQHIYKKDLTWSILWEAIKRLQGSAKINESGHYGNGGEGTETGWKRDHNQFSSPIFNKHLTQLKNMVSRMGFEHVFDYQQVGTFPIQRRFGAAIANIWRWTLGEAFGDGDSLRASLGRGLSGDGDVFRDAFPWRQCLPRQLPTIERWLDCGVDQWSHIECFLQEDFNHLAADSRWCSADECIVSLEWRLVLQDLTEIALPIHFRHPLLLQRELGPQSTALLQAHYAFENWQHEQQAVIQRDDHDEVLLAVLTTNPIIAWRIILTSTTPQLKSERNLFDFDTVFTRSLDRLAVLANKLPRPLLHYQLQSDWGVTDSFAEYSLGRPRKNDEHLRELALPSMLAQGRSRPLYIFPEPYLLEDGLIRKSKMTFLERRTDKWWERPSGETASPSCGEQVVCYDYFQLIDHRHRALWVCRTPLNKWYVHGIFA